MAFKVCNWALCIIAVLTLLVDPLELQVFIYKLEAVTSGLLAQSRGCSGEHVAFVIKQEERKGSHFAHLYRW
jgi:hypothetical protein